LWSFLGGFFVLVMRSGIVAPARGKAKRQNRKTAKAAGRSTVQTRPVSDKKPGKPRFMSSQREQFCRLIAFKGYTASEAYREAYDTEAADHTVHVESSKLRNDPEVIARIDALQRPALLAGEVSLDGHIDTLRKLRDLAVLDGQLSVAVTAETNVGKVKGFYVERKLQADVSLEDLVAGSYGQAPKHESGHAVEAVARSKKRSR
jgi:hypothetical protein